MGQEWDDISPEAKDLVKQMLVYQMDHRLSAQDCLNHPWFSKVSAPELSKLNQPVGRRSLKNLKNFRSESKLQEAIYFFIVNQLTSNEEKDELY